MRYRTKQSKTTQTPATTEIENWLRSGYSKIFDSGPDPGPKEKHRIVLQKKTRLARKDVSLR